MKKDDDPKFWIQLLKLVVGAAILIGLVGWALWHVGTYQTAKPPALEPNSWGIAKDPPMR